MPAPASVLLNRLMARAKFRHVQVLLRLAELGSVQRAAQAIGLTQSSVTQTLAYLENLLELRLFQRHARGVTPTPACLDLLPVARQMMFGLAEAAESVHARQAHGGGRVRLLASVAAVQGLLLQALPTFHRRHPQVQVNLAHAEGEDQLLAVARGEVDLVVCRRPAAVPEGWRFLELLEDRFVIVCAPGHTVLQRRRIDWKVLGRETWMLPPAETSARRTFEQFAQNFGTPPCTHPLVSRLYTLAMHLLQHEGVLALLPLSFVRHALERGELVELPTPLVSLPMDPMGMLQPASPAPAASLLAEHLSVSWRHEQLAPSASRRSPAGGGQARRPAVRTGSR